MTKNVRIENADNSDYKVRVYSEERQPDGSWKRVLGSDGEPHVVELNHPTAMATLTIWSGKRLVIEEGS